MSFPNRFPVGFQWLSKGSGGATGFVVFGRALLSPKQHYVK